jgi:U4/U6.U5 tri-snRNP-associated protein 1
MTVDVPPPPEPSTANDTFVDDDDLQALLARERRAKMKKARLDPEEIARRSESEFLPMTDKTDVLLVAEEQQEERANVDMEPKAEEESEGLVFDDTSEFVRAITYDPTAAAAATTQASETPAKREESMPQRSLSPVQPKEEEDDEAVLHAMQVDENDGGLEDGEEVVKPEESEVCCYADSSSQL